MVTEELTNAHFGLSFTKKHAPNRMQKRRTRNSHLPKCSCKMRILFFKNKMMQWKNKDKTFTSHASGYYANLPIILGVSSLIVLTLAPFFEGSSIPNERAACCKKGFLGFCFVIFGSFSILLEGGKKLYKRRCTLVARSEIPSKKKIHAAGFFFKRGYPAGIRWYFGGASNSVNIAQAFIVRFHLQSSVQTGAMPR